MSRRQTEERPPNAALSPPVPETGILGMRLFLASLSVLFAASITAYLVVRARAATWPPPDMPSLPSGLWLSTAIILASSLTVQRALSSARRDRRAQIYYGLLLTSALGVAFLFTQAINWWRLLAAHVTAGVNLYAFTFFTLTGLHAAHVIGGLIPLIIVTARARRGLYSSRFHPGVYYCTAYWHFLDIVWLVMFSLIFLLA